MPQVFSLSLPSPSPLPFSLYLTLARYALENGCPNRDAACNEAASAGHYETLKYTPLPSLPLPFSPSPLFASLSHPLRYAHEHGCEWNAKSYAVTFGGSIDCLSYALKHGFEWDAQVCQFAAVYGRCDVLKYESPHSSFFYLFLPSLPNSKYDFEGLHEHQ
jgi:hypothetical protein